MFAVLVLAALAAALAALSQGKTWPMLGAQCLLGLSWWISKRSRGTAVPLPWMMAVAGVVFLCTVAPPSSADESAYRFQARVFASGRLAAPAPAGNVLVNNTHKNEFFLIHTIQREGKWFVQYYPGWPAILALPERLSVGPFVNPVMGLLVVWLTWRIALFLGGPQTGGLAAFFLVASPMFLLNFSGYYSHGISSVLVSAAAWWSITDSGESRRNVLLAVAAVALCGLIRPLTGIVCGLPLLLLPIWKRRGRRGELAVCMALFAFFAGAALFAQALYNYLQAGSPWRSLYSVYRGGENLRLLSATPLALLSNFQQLTIRSLIKTGASVFGFPALAGGIWLALRERRPEYTALAALVALLPLAHTIVSEQSDTVIGERFYMEGLFAVMILAAAGLKGSAPRWLLFFTLAVSALSTFWFWRIYSERRAPYVTMETLARQHTNPEEVLFLSGNGHPAFEPEDINLNYPDWKARTFSMTDPGPDRRNAIACLLGRKRWTVLSPGAAPVTGTARCRARLEGDGSTPLVAGGDAHK